MISSKQSATGAVLLDSLIVGLLSASLFSTNSIIQNLGNGAGIFILIVSTIVLYASAISADEMKKLIRKELIAHPYLQSNAWFLYNILSDIVIVGLSFALGMWVTGTVLIVSKLTMTSVRTEIINELEEEGDADHA